MHSLYKTACRLETSLTAEVVIGHLRLMLTPAASHAEVRTRRNAATVTVSNATGTLVMTLLAGAPHPHAEHTEAIPQNALPWRSFSVDEVHAFVTAMDDRNPIHQGDCPVVPGYQMLTAWLQGHRDVVSCDMRFHHAVKSNTLIYLTTDGGMVQAYTAFGLAFTLSFKKEWQNEFFNST